MLPSRTNPSGPTCLGHLAQTKRVLSHNSAYSPIAIRDKRHNHAIQAKSHLRRGQRPERGPSAWSPPPHCARTSVVRAGATICGRITARFHSPIVVASAPGGRNRQAIAQSATRNTPQPRPASKVAATATNGLGIRARRGAPPSQRPRRWSRRAVCRPGRSGRAASAAPAVPIAVNERMRTAVNWRACTAGICNVPTT